jgi:hypothetical protein
MVEEVTEVTQEQSGRYQEQGRQQERGCKQQQGFQEQEFQHSRDIMNTRDIGISWEGSRNTSNRGDAINI